MKKQNIVGIAVIAYVALCAAMWPRNDEVGNFTTVKAKIEPESTGNVIYVPLQPPVTKDSTPSPYKPNGEPYNP